MTLLHESGLQMCGLWGTCYLYLLSSSSPSTWDTNSLRSRAVLPTIETPEMVFRGIQLITCFNVVNYPWGSCS